MLFLVPGVREEHHHAIKTGVRQAKINDIVGIDTVNPDIFKAPILDLLEQCADTGLMNFNPDKILLGSRFGHLCQGPSHAKTDFQVKHVVSAKNLTRVDHSVLAGQAVLRPTPFKRLFLAFRHAALAQNEATHTATGRDRGIGGIFGILRFFLVCHLQSLTAGSGSV